MDAFISDANTESSSIFILFFQCTVALINRICRDGHRRFSYEWKTRPVTADNNTTIFQLECHDIYIAIIYTNLNIFNFDRLQITLKHIHTCIHVFSMSTLSFISKLFATHQRALNSPINRTYLIQHVVKANKKKQKHDGVLQSTAI